MMKKKITTIILADKQDLTAAGFVYFLQSVPEFSFLLLEAINQSDLIRKLASHPQALVILDYPFFDFPTILKLAHFCKKYKSAHFFLFLFDLEDTSLREIVRNQYSFSILLKRCSKIEILEAVKKIFQGEPFICESVAIRMREYAKRESLLKTNYKLTKSEIGILKLLVSGMGTKKIADQRYSSIHTITTHRKNIFRKLEANSLQEAIRKALQIGLISTEDYQIKKN